MVRNWSTERYFFQVEACEEQTVNHYDSQSTEQPFNNEFRRVTFCVVSSIVHTMLYIYFFEDVHDKLNVELEE